LSGDRVKGSFNQLDMHTLAWFPWLNLRFGLYSGHRPILRTLLWTLVLGPIAIMLHLTATVWLIIGAGFITLRNKRAKDDDDHTVSGSSVIGTILDNVAADASNYVSSAASATPEGSPLQGTAASIQQRLVDAVRAAAGGDSRRNIVIVAHSLGSVIAYH